MQDPDGFTSNSAEQQKQNQTRGNISKFTVEGQYHPNTKDRKYQYQEIKLPISISDEQRSKNSQYNSSRPKSAAQ